jgi:hypothetical protein
MDGMLFATSNTSLWRALVLPDLKQWKWALSTNFFNPASSSKLLPNSALSFQLLQQYFRHAILFTVDRSNSTMYLCTLHLDTLSSSCASYSAPGVTTVSSFSANHFGFFAIAAILPASHIDIYIFNTNSYRIITNPTISRTTLSGATQIYGLIMFNGYRYYAYYSFAPDWVFQVYYRNWQFERYIIGTSTIPAPKSGMAVSFTTDLFRLFNKTSRF